jgi:hypothetical protein
MVDSPKLPKLELLVCRNNYNDKMESKYTHYYGYENDSPK